MLAGRLIMRTDIVICAKRYHIAVPREKFRYIGRKRRVAAAMLTNAGAVYKDDRMIIDSPEMQDDAFAAPLRRDIDRAFIPHGSDKISVSDTGKAAFGTKRNIYFTV